jgi:hypothetical protein
MHATAPVHDKFHSRLGTLLTSHASKRLRKRGLSLASVDAAMTYGRVVHVRGADIHAIGRKEVELFERDGIDLSPYEGLQVVCSSAGAVLTVYRNRDFRGLRPHHRRRRARRRVR